MLQRGERIDAHTLIVAIGASSNPVVRQLDLPMDRGRLRVDPTLRLVGQTSIWALGDCAAVPHPRTGQAAPPTAQFALREGKTVARNIVAAIEGRSPSRFGFTGLGEMVSLGHGAAVAERLKVAGTLAWLMWRTFYLARLGQGDSFGELGLLQHRRRTATVRAIEPVDVIILGRSDFDLLAGIWKNLGQSLDELARTRTSPARQG